MKITIHRGAHEIGGSCVQITSGSRSILLDAGLPLAESRSHVDLAKLEFNDIFISHSHQDHFGMIEGLAADKTVHIGPTASRLIAATRVFLGKSSLTNSFSPLQNREWIEVASGFRVMPYLMDHSCVDAFGFLVEAEGKRLYYSGDFRAHGRRRQAFEWFLDDPPRNIDLLLLEGTMMGRGNAAFKDEEAVERGMLEVLRKYADRACFLICSGQHIDRISAAFRACRQAGRIFVTDIYTAFILHTVASRFPSVPEMNSVKEIKVLTKGKTASCHYQRVAQNREFFGDFTRDIFKPDTMIGIDEILAEPSRYFLKVSYFADLLKQMDNCSVIYSMWSGYLDEPKNRRIQEHPKITFHEIHTSGHAIRKDLKRLASALKPRRVIPIHTERREDYQELFDNVQLLPDGESFCV